MSEKRKALDARKDEQGHITQVLLEGNKNFTPIDTAIKMTENEQVDLVVVNRGGKKHLRTRPDDQEGNNLDSMADE